jgi:cytochrome b561
MTYQEKGAWVYILAVAVSATIYATTIIGQLGQHPVNDVDFGPSLLWSLGISIGLSIVLRIVVEILTPSDSYKIDARDRAISHKAAYVNGTMIAIGMAGPLLLSVMDFDNFWVANAIYAVFVISAIVSSIVQVVTYRRGF